MVSFRIVLVKHSLQRDVLPKRYSYFRALQPSLQEPLIVREIAFP
ncbi:MAG: hypothetical protein AAFY57_13275 [Cyanobacteria bacterium J06642_2]